MFRILFVCTGNVCRSPMAECFTKAALAGQAGISVRSAGTRTVAGIPISRHARDVLKRAGVDAGSFVSRPLFDEMVVEADLVLTAARSHRAEVVAAVPSSASRAFTIAEFGALARAVPEALILRFADAKVRGQALISEVGRRRGLVYVEQPDLVDPIGCSRRVFKAVGRRIADELSVPIRLLGGIGTEGLFIP